MTTADGSVWLGGTTVLAGVGFWSGLKDDIVRRTGGEGFVPLVAALALGGLLLGLRGRVRRRRASA
ncbi:hypothetical protein ACFYY2_09880 [Streptomyces sp. NPDC001822]|uniref:hypothetical protein n=1 Tax=Streptomyces sp. NPDC001822 TaxID=3364614 RepID=UPI0036ABA4ED